MSTYTEIVGEKLNALLAKTYDAEKGFIKASENAKGYDLKAYFKKKAIERKNFGHTLRDEIQNFGQKIEEGGSVEGAMHRTWMDIEAFFSSDNDESMLSAAIAGEKSAIEEYDDVLKEINLPPSTATLLTQQRNQIADDLITIKTLEDIS